MTGFRHPDLIAGVVAVGGGLPAIGGEGSIVSDSDLEKARAVLADLKNVKVVGFSMSPTLGNSERYLLKRWVYHFRSPATSDVVVIEDPADHGFSVKRVIAVEGETVYFKDGHVYVNGRELKEAYLARGTRTFASYPQKDALFKCGKDQFFLLGDNRENSVDSRTYGPVPRSYILGQIIQ